MTPAGARRPRRPGRRPGRDGGLGFRAPRPVARLAALAASAGPGLRRWPPRLVRAAPGAAARAAGPRCSSLAPLALVAGAGRAARLQPRHGRHRAHRRAPVRPARPSPPSAGPVARAGGSAGGGGFGGAGGCPGPGSRRLGGPGPGVPADAAGSTGRHGGIPGGTAGRPAGNTSGRRHRRPSGRSGRFRGGQGGGIGGGLGGNTQVSSAVTRLLTSGAAGYRWAAATVGAESAAPFQLASGEPIMAIGGFNGTDQTPTLAAVQAAGRRAQDPLLHRRERAQLRRRLRRRDPDHHLGGSALHEPRPSAARPSTT